MNASPGARENRERRKDASLTHGLGMQPLLHELGWWRSQSKNQQWRPQGGSNPRYRRERAVS